MDRETELRILAEVACSSAETAGPPTYLEVDRYTSAERAKLELARVFRTSWLIVARSLVMSAISAVADFQPLDSPLNILVTGLTLLGLVALATSVVDRRRTASPRP